MTNVHYSCDIKAEESQIGVLTGMKLHEYQAKEIFSKEGIPTPNGHLVDSADEIPKAMRAVTGPPWVVKAQVHAGGRGKAGGVKVARNSYEVAVATEGMLGKPLATKQTGGDGIKVTKVLIEDGVEIDREFYLGMVVDRETRMPTMIFSQAGGMEIEEVAARTPGLILKEHINPITGWLPYQAGNLIYSLDPLPSPGVRKGLASVMANVYKVFIANDCSMVEINPLVVTKDGKVIAVDAKMTIDDNALFRQKDLIELDDPNEKDPLELKAEKYNLNYIRLDGNVGAMVNGAGLAMATMDVIKAAGAAPANFLDVGGGANEEMISKGFEIILLDRRVRAILINIFGGILRCDVLARGVVAAAKTKSIRVPLIVRLEGTNVEEGRKILQESGLKFLVAKDLAEVAELVSKQVQGM
ncbi:succinyl-CoA synthetase, beta subunit [uncultured Desulfobacterium sp.]|uniref:Succinate--CoA ligase [ADP-forming] subunit beta n=1 Tax=uncultured Desulfobacterium sp. TaxID=201089 RepID=A0A445MZ41_9BACT|nr:succinyl-CoA synthetase, beta subunit [uncultured Desulfobacterium sp.]